MYKTAQPLGNPGGGAYEGAGELAMQMRNDCRRGTCADECGGGMVAAAWAAAAWAVIETIGMRGDRDGGMRGDRDGGMGGGRGMGGGGRGMGGGGDVTYKKSPQPNAEGPFSRSLPCSARGASGMELVVHSLR